MGWWCGGGEWRKIGLDWTGSEVRFGRPLRWRDIFFSLFFVSSFLNPKSNIWASSGSGSGSGECLVLGRNRNFHLPSRASTAFSIFSPVAPPPMRPYIKVGICRRHWEMGTRAAVERRARPEQLAPEPGSAPRARDVLNTLSYAIDSLYRTLGFGTSMVCVGILPVVLRVYQGCADVHGNARALPCRHHLPPCPLRRKKRW